MGRAGTGSRYGFSALAGNRSTAKMFFLGTVMLAIALAAKLLIYAFGQSIFSGSMQSIYPIYRSFEMAAELGGSFVGALALGIGRANRGKAFVYWSMIATLSLIDTAGLLLSAALSVLFSAIVGSAAGRGKVPWLLLGISFAVASFLHLGKMEMRTRYMNPRTGQDQRTLSSRTLGLPQFYLEWCEASFSNIFAEKSSTRSSADEDHGLLSRLDNLQNMNAVVGSLQRGVPLFGGRSYTMIPMLAIPRFLWPDKPRTHEAQAQFNLHFGRQGSVKETLQTYIAIGLLPEAVGNFGFLLGPILIGATLGFAAGWLERAAMWKQVVSLEGMLLFAVISHLALSFEISAAVLVTATLQIMVAVVGGYILLELGLGSMTGAAAGR